MPLNFNTDPYFDDYSESKKFHKILFRPGYPVQARELTQLQTILQTQIARHGGAIFKQGAMVVPGQMTVDPVVDYVAVQNLFSGSDVSTYIDLFLGTTITGSSGITAQVVHVVRATGSDPHLLFIRYTKAATDTTTKTFSTSEVLTNGSYSVAAATLNATGKGSLAFIQKGIYFVNGYFVMCDAQRLVLDKFGITPSYKIGLRFNETISTPETDSTLLDNAQGSYNFAAPGAHRHAIDLKLDKVAPNSVDDVNFVTLSVIVNGDIQRDTKITEYSDLEKTLARRTFDESGSYTVRDFNLDVREYRNNNRGAWVTGTPYLTGDVVTNGGITYVCVTQGVSSAAPTATGNGTLQSDGSLVWEVNSNPDFNRGVVQPTAAQTTLAAHLTDEAKLAIGLEPGKAYVQGFEIEKIATEFVPTPKARTTPNVTSDNVSIPVNVGNYCLVTKLYSLPTAFGIVTLYDRYVSANGSAPAGGNIVGTARVKAVEFDSGTPGTTGIYKLFLFDVKMNTGLSFARSVKSFVGSGFTFTANINPVLTQLTGSISNTTTAVTGNGTNFQSDLIALDYIRVNGEDVQVASITSQNALTLIASPVSGNLTNQQYFAVRAKMNEGTTAGLIFPTPFYATASIANIVYQVYEALPGATSDASSNVTFTYSGSGTLTSGGGLTNYLVFANGVPVNPTGVTVTGNQVTFNNVGISTPCTCIAAVQYTGAAGVTEKTKTLASQTTVFSTVAATGTILVLDKADGFKLGRVEMDTSVAFGGAPTFAAPVDISDRYEFNSGQTETYYGPAYVKLKPSYSPPTNPIRVVFQYFTHGTGHFFSKNSYSIDYKKIPTFEGKQLRDCLDFRPRLDTGTVISGTQVPKRGVNHTASISYYLPRKDKVAIAANGKFIMVNGDPSVNASEPDLDPASMLLYSLTLEPYTFSNKQTSVVIAKADNKRYTMRDIGKLEKRISNLEYYTSLTLLEQETDAMNVRDSTGNTRFKNGFVVDSFNNTGLGDLSNSDYTASVDIDQSQLRPYFVSRNVNLIEQASNDTARASANYKMYGDLITLPLDSTTPMVPLVSQPLGTHVENINPFAVFTFIGNAALYPETDEWFETNRLPDVVQNVEGNFSALTTALANSGVLGTVWNGWQNQWSGVPTVVANSSSIEQGWSGAQTQVTTTTSQTAIGQTRTGMTTTVVPNFVQTQVGDRTLSTALVPYIRSRYILVQATKLKPNSRFYPYFDNVDVSAYCTPATKIVYNLTSTKEFDTASNIGGNQTQAGRLINGDSVTAFNKGDLVTFTGGATAVVVGASNIGGVRTLEVMNVIGTVSNGNTITGSVQDASLNVATGTVVSVTVPTTMVTDASGSLNLLFNIPNTNAVRFRTGVRVFNLYDSNAANVLISSRAKGSYSAVGIIETKQATIQSTRNGLISQQAATDTRTIVQTSDTVSRTTLPPPAAAEVFSWFQGGPEPTSGSGDGGGDPLSQTFYVQSTGGAFLSKVDIFFATKDPLLPVTLEIREVVNGYPGAKVLPFSRVVLQPSQVNISTNSVLVNGASTPAFDTPTSFTFRTPVYVEDGKQYALVLLSDTQGYNVWIAQMGEIVPGTSRPITEQPNLGSLFKSQNASTWTADQNQDLMFTIYRCKFNTSVVGAARFVNDQLPTGFAQSSPFETRAGSTSMRVHVMDHGLTPTSTVTLSDFRAGTGTITTTTASTAVTLVGSTWPASVVAGAALYTSTGAFIGRVQTVNTTTTITLAANAAVAVTAGAYQYQLPIAGIPADQVFTTFTSLSNIQADSFVVTVGTAATASGYSGGTTVRATTNMLYDVMQPIVHMLNFPETNVDVRYFGTTGTSVNGAQTPYVSDSSYTVVAPNDNVFFASPDLVLSKSEEASKIAGNKSVKFDLIMTSTNDAVSPVIDTQRISMIAVSNRVNSPTTATVNLAALDSTTIASNNLIQLSGLTVFSADSATQTLLAGIAVGREITISGASAGANNGSYIVTDVSATGTVTVRRAAGNFTTQGSGVSTITVNMLGNFGDEVSPLGSTSLSKYVTKKVKLDNASTFLRIRTGQNLPVGSSVEVYYRTNLVGATTDLQKQAWVLATPDVTVPAVPVGSDVFQDVNFSINNMIPFDAIQVKIVMKSTNSSAVPRCKDLRIIACA